MSKLNYHHLYYFFVVAKEGSVSKAALKLRLAQPTVSSQIKQLEENFKHDLFEKTGRGLMLTQTGKKVFEEAKKIFELGDQLQKDLESNSKPFLTKLSLGVPDTVPKMLVTSLLAKFLRLSNEHSVYCREGTMDVLLSHLLERKIDLIVTDTLPPKNLKIKIHKQLVGRSQVGIYSKFSLEKFNRLKEVPAILPIRNSAMRSLVEDWTEHRGMHLRVIAEVEDSALVKNLASDVQSVVFEIMAIEEEVLKRFNLHKVGETNEYINYYAITLDKKNRAKEIEQFLEIVSQTFLSDKKN